MMEFTGEYRIPAARDKVWEALNDPEILKVCIDGCEELEWAGHNEMSAKVRAKVGPVSARFNGTLRLTDLNPPQSYVLSGQAKGGAAGFAKGAAEVVLREDGADGTILHYTAKASVGGKLASVGGRLISGVVQKNADGFFERLSNRLSVAVRAAEVFPEELAAEEAVQVPTGPVQYPKEVLAEEPRPPAELRPLPPGRIPVDARFIIIPAGWLFALVALGLLFLL